MNSELDNQLEEMSDTSDLSLSDSIDASEKEDEDEVVIVSNSKVEHFINIKTLEKKKKGGFYFDNDRAEELIKEYQRTLVRDPVTKKVISCDRKVEEELMLLLYKIAKAIINNYSYWKFDRTDELEAEAMGAMWKYLPNFDSSKGNAFSLFSLICKKHLYAFTKNQLNHRLNYDIDVHPECQDQESRYTADDSFNLVIENFEFRLNKIVEENFKDTENYKAFKDLSAILTSFMSKYRLITKKTELYNYIKSYGYKKSDYKKFITAIEPYKNFLYGVDD